MVPVCHKLLEKNLVVSRSSNDPRSQLFRTLRTTIIKQMRANNWRSIGIISPSPGEGKSLVASNLAAAIAMEVNYTALLVDMDFATQGLKTTSRLSQNVGLSDYLKGDAEIADLLVNPGVERYCCFTRCRQCRKFIRANIKPENGQRCLMKSPSAISHEL